MKISKPFAGAIEATVDILTESPRRTLTEAARRENKAPSTIWRWALKGCRGVKLETFLHGGTRCTTDPALRRFFDAINGASSLSTSPIVPSGSRQAEIAAAERELADAGV